MEKIWYIKIWGKQLGPYSIEQLKCMPEVTPDTLVWYPKLKKWVPMRSIPELKEVFKDSEEDVDEEEQPCIKDKKLTNELVLELQTDPPPLPFWFFVILTAIAILLWQLFLKS
jgi:hypothetical protein